MTIKHIKNKKGMDGLSQMPSAILMFGVAFVILGFAAILMTSLRDGVTRTNASGEWNNGTYDILNDSLAGTEQIGNQGSNIGLVIVIIIIIGLLLGGFGYLMKKKMG